MFTIHFAFIAIICDLSVQTTVPLMFQLCLFPF